LSQNETLNFIKQTFPAESGFNHLVENHGCGSSSMLQQKTPVMAKSVSTPSSKYKVGHWTDLEKSMFMQGIKQYGKDWRTI